MSATGVVVVTGAAGFVGRALVQRLRAAGREVRPVVREDRGGIDGAMALGPLEQASPEALARVLDGAAAVVHLAARAHATGDRGSDAEAAYRAANVEATKRLVLRDATVGSIASGVKPVLRDATCLRSTKTGTADTWGVCDGE